MFGSNMLEVAIGVVFVYVVLSLAGTAFNEIITRMLALRAKTLEDGIRRLLNDPDGTLTNEIYEHPLIKAFYRPTTVDNWLSKLPRVERKGFPSYISSRTFALVLLDTFAPEKAAGRDASADSSTNPAPVESNDNPTPAESSPEGGEFGGLPSWLRSLIDAVAGGGSSVQGATADADDEQDRFEEFRDLIEKSSANEDLKKALLTLVDDADGKAETARKNIENWFDSSMERVTGWYTRKVGLITAVFAIVIVILTNADTITMIQEFSQDTVLSASIVEAADEMVKNDQLPTMPLEEIQQVVEELQIPLGWCANKKDPCAVPDTANEWLLKIAGLGLTALAISLGGPFWFDLLGQLVNLRKSGKVPPTAAEAEQAQKQKPSTESAS